MGKRKTKKAEIIEPRVLLKYKIHFTDGTNTVKETRTTKTQVLNSCKVGSYMSVGYGDKGMREIKGVEFLES